MASPINIRKAKRDALKLGCTITPSKGSHLKVSHPSLTETFIMPGHGKGGTMSQGVSVKWTKFIQMIEVLTGITPKAFVR